MVEILNVSNLSTAFQSDYGSKQALKNISFKINEGEVLALVGESGSGGCAPNPRKLKDAIEIIAPPKSIVAITIIIGNIFGRI